MEKMEDAGVAMEWRYKGEGASNVVLDYHGSNPNLVGRVLRIRKAHFGGRICDSVLSEPERKLWKEYPSISFVTNEEELRHAYVRDAMQPLLGAKYVDSGIVLAVSLDFLVAVADNIRDKRPAWRAEEADIDFTSQHVLLVCDHTRFSHVPGSLSGESPTLSIEIKPKWGYLPQSDAISEQNQIKKQVCRFTMHQQLKYAQGKIKRRSSYCPLDLFSDARDRILKAVKSLFRTPQNNLRLFLNGDRIFTGSFDGSEDSTENTVSLEHLENLLENFIHSDKAQKHGGIVELLQNIIADILYTSDALRCLLSIQKYDMFDIEGIIHVFYSFMQQHCPVCADCSQEVFTRFHRLENEEQRQLLCNFLIAATAKDCSMMVTLKPVNSAQANEHIITCHKTGQSYLYKVSFLDLDMKRLDKIPYYYELDQHIVTNFLKPSS